MTERQSEVTHLPVWHYAGDIVGVEFWVDPEVIAPTLPNDVQLDPSSIGHAVALFGDWQFVREPGEPFYRTHGEYREFVMLIDAFWHGMPVSYCPDPCHYIDGNSVLVGVDRHDHPLACPVVHLTRAFAAPGKASSPVEPGGQFSAMLSLAGQRFVEADIQLSAPATNLAEWIGRPKLMSMRYPSTPTSNHRSRPWSELFLLTHDHQRFEQAWTGSGELLFPIGTGEELAWLTPVKVGAGFRASWSYAANELTAAAIQEPFLSWSV